MTRKLYIGLFMLLSILFVPVVLNLGLAMQLAPICCVSLDFLHSENPWEGLWVFIHIFVYCSAFYVAALITFWLSGVVSAPRVVRIILQTSFLLAVFSCSFARVITYSSIRGDGGNYNF